MTNQPRLMNPTASWSLADMHGLLLDFNGTLSNDERLLCDLIRRMAWEYLGVHLTAERYTADCSGLSDRSILTLLAHESTRPHSSIDVMLAELSDRYRRAAASVELISQPARDFVREASVLGLALAVVTGASRTSVLPALRRAGLHELLSTVVAEEDVTDGKPHPEGYLRGAVLLGLRDPRRVVVLEDSIPGMLAARAAGMRVLAVAGTHTTDELWPHCDGVLDALRPSVLSQRFS